MNLLKEPGRITSHAIARKRPNPNKPLLLTIPVPILPIPPSPTAKVGPARQIQTASGGWLKR